MKRTTIYLEPELGVLLKLETRRRKKPMAELIREAVRSYLRREPGTAPPGAGAFSGGSKDTSERAEELLGKLKFGQKR